MKKRGWLGCWALLALLLAGCDYTVPLFSEGAGLADDELVGLWERAKAQRNPERLLVLPAGDSSYLVVYPAERRDALYAVATLGTEGGRTWVQLRWLGSGKGHVSEGDRVYQFASYEIRDGLLSTWMLNPAVVSKEVDSRDALVSALLAHDGAADLLKDERVFRRVLE